MKAGTMSLDGRVWTPLWREYVGVVTDYAEEAGLVVKGVRRRMAQPVGDVVPSWERNALVQVVTNMADDCGLPTFEEFLQNN